MRKRYAAVLCRLVKARMACSVSLSGLNSPLLASEKIVGEPLSQPFRLTFRTACICKEYSWPYFIEGRTQLSELFRFKMGCNLAERHASHSNSGGSMTFFNDISQTRGRLT
jgi:hypothetical protein